MHRRPFGILRTPIPPNGQWRIVPVPVTAAPGRPRGYGSRRPARRWCLAGLIPQAVPDPAQVRFRASQRGYGVIAAPTGGQSHQ